MKIRMYVSHVLKNSPFFKVILKFLSLLCLQQDQNCGNAQFNLGIFKLIYFKDYTYRKGKKHFENIYSIKHLILKL